MGPHVGAYDSSGPRAGSPGPPRGDRKRCKSACYLRNRGRLNLLAVLVVATLLGCTTIVRQLIATNHGRVSYAGDPTRPVAPVEDRNSQIESIVLDDISAALRQGSSMASMPSNGPELWKEAQPPEEESAGSPLIPQHVVQNLLLDRRFVGQKTGRPPMIDEELYKPPPPSTGPFGWGTDWARGVSVLYQGLEVIEASWCKDVVSNSSFVEHVMARRASAVVNPSNRVASCVRTKDSGRYLPEWLAYHWALGVDEFLILDDQSEDDTRPVLEPFIQAGIVKFQQRHIRSGVDERIEPLNECVAGFREMQDHGEPSAPRWLLLIDDDEYLWAGDILSTLSNVLETYSTTCCLKVPRVQYGSSGLTETPRGLVIENFLMHAEPSDEELNGLPKMIVDFRPRNETLGSFKRLTSPHDSEDCKCDAAPVEELAVLHYSLTLKDFALKTRRYWGSPQRSDQELKEMFRKRDINDLKSTDMLVWGCTVRHVLDRAANGKHIITGKPSPSLSPHHPVSHGMRPLDPYGEHEAARSAACTDVLMGASTTASGNDWGNSSEPLPWVKQFCDARYVFVHSFKGTGGTDVVEVLEAHPWVKAHWGKAAVARGGASLTSPIRTSREMAALEEDALRELCGCSSADTPGCWRFCPAHQQQLLSTEKVNNTRRQLYQDWVLRFEYQSFPGKPLILVEKDFDMLVQAKQGLFPNLSTSVLTVRHPLCTTVLTTSISDAKLARGLTEWRNVWRHVLWEQLPQTEGDVWVLRFEDLLVQKEEVSSALWAAIGLPPIAPYPGSKASLASPAGEPAFIARALEAGSGDVLEESSVAKAAAEAAGRGVRAERGSVSDGVEGEREETVLRRRLMYGDALSKAPSSVRSQAVPFTCRARIQACEKGKACSKELQRSAVLMEFFGFGGSGEVLNSQRFLWGKEELVWLGKRLA